MERIGKRQLPRHVREVRPRRVKVATPCWGDGVQREVGWTNLTSTHSDSSLDAHLDVVVQPYHNLCSLFKPISKDHDGEINGKRTCCKFLNITFYKTLVQYYNLERFQTALTMG